MDVSTDKAPLLDPNQQYPPANGAGSIYAGPPQYSQPQSYHYPQPQTAQNPGAQAWTQSPVTSQPQVQHMSYGIYNQTPSQWSSGLCDCCKKPGACMLDLFCPCIFTGMLAKRLGSSFAYGCCCDRHFEMIARPYVRAKHSIEGNFCNDCMVSTFCGPCSSCQIDRELDKLGYPN